MQDTGTEELSSAAQADYNEAPKDTPPPPPPSTLAFLNLAETDRKKLFSVANKSNSRLRKILDGLTIDGARLCFGVNAENEKQLILEGEVVGKGANVGDALAEATADIPAADLYKLVGPTLVAMLVADKLIGQTDKNGKVVGPFVADNRHNRRALGIPGKVALQKALDKANEAIAEAKVEQAIENSTETLVAPTGDIEVVATPEGIPTGGSEA